MNTIRFCGMALAGLALAACAPMSAQRNVEKPSEEAAHVLSQYYWDRAAPEAGEHRHPVRLQFTEGRLVATRLCNTMSAPYRVDGAQLTVNQFVSTMMMCGDPSLMQWERYVAQHLPTVRDYVVAMPAGGKGPTLTLNFQQGESWMLQGQPTPETRYGGSAERVFLEVAPEKVQCNHPLQGQSACLRVREIKYSEAGVKTSTGEWETFHGEIEGYQFQPGMRQVLRLKRFTRQHPAADQSRYVHVLDMVVETELLKP